MKITKTQAYLVLIFFIAIILRIISAHNTHVSTDEMIYSIIPLNIIDAKIMGTIEQSPLFFYLTDLGYKIFGGVSAISIRLSAIIFGSLTCLVIFLIIKEIWNKKSGLYGAFFFAISGYALKFNYEMDIVAYFFGLLSMLFFIKFNKEKIGKYFYLTVLFFALAILVKIVVIFFLPAYVIFWLVQGRENLVKLKNKKIQKIIIAGVILGFLLLSPIFIHNYQSYKAKGITNYFFSNIAGIGETAHSGLQVKPWSLSRMWEISKEKMSLFLQIDLVILVFGLSGIFFTIKNKKNEIFLLLFSLIFVHLYTAGITGSASHYLWHPIILSIFAGIGMVNISKKIKFKHFSLLIILFALGSSFMVIKDITNEREESITLKLRDYVKQNIPDEAIVVIDPRIYNGIHAWVFNDKHYINGQSFFELANQLEKVKEGKKRVPLYYIECGTGTNCGWKPEDFERIFDTGESISKFFQENTLKVAEINAYHNFNIYSGTFEIVPSIYEAIDRTHVFWFYPTGWKYPELAVDYYEVKGFNKLINFFGFMILWANVILSILSIPFVLYLVFKKTKKSAIV